VPASGGALLVGNHALLGIDSVALFPELFHQTGRVPRGLALRDLFSIRPIGRALHKIGLVSGDRSTAVDLLGAGELCVCYPGGIRDSLKGPDARYELRWGERRGFAAAAASAGVPVVPVAAIGPDDAYPQLRAAARLQAAILGPERLPAPVFLPVPRRVSFHFFFGRPIAPPPEPGAASVAAFAAEAREALEGLIDDGLTQVGGSTSTARTSSRPTS
jgi:1-acyl-sn-glycerol-3-phosphate acyltransferase